MLQAKIENHRLVDDNGNIYHDNINGYLGYIKYNDDPLETFVLLFEEDLSKTPYKNNGDSNSDSDNRSKTLPLLSLIPNDVQSYMPKVKLALSSVALNNDVLVYQYVGYRNQTT